MSMVGIEIGHSWSGPAAQLFSFSRALTELAACTNGSPSGSKILLEPSASGC